jgi:ribosomal protein S18 acetylase RimI-like enzyme
VRRFHFDSAKLDSRVCDAVRMVIRRGDAAEALLLRDLVERAYSVYVERIGRRPAPMDDNYEEKTQQGQLFVADDGAIVGLIVLIKTPDHLLIENVAVDPARQGTGIGRALLDFAEIYARENGLSEIKLYTNEAMAENLRFYPRLGFREDERRTENGFRRVFYSKGLTR